MADFGLRRVDRDSPFPRRAGRKSDEGIEVLARFGFEEKFMNRLLRFIFGYGPCLPTGDINPPSLRTAGGVQLDRLEYHFPVILQGLRLIMPDMLVFVGGDGKGGLFRRDVSGGLK